MYDMDVNVRSSIIVHASQSHIVYGYAFFFTLCTLISGNTIFAYNSVALDRMSCHFVLEIN